jgi:hypothetical protein
MENKVSIWKNSINYGLIAGFLMIALSIILWLLGLMENGWLNSLGYLILAFAMYIGATNWRDKLNGGWMSYGEAFKTGFFVTLIAAALGIVYAYAFFEFIDPEFMSSKMLEAENAILETNPNMSDEDLETAMGWATKFSSPIILSIFDFIGKVIFGTIISLIVAIFAKKVNPADVV